jgi:hypothetical protein
MQAASIDPKESPFSFWKAVSVTKKPNIWILVEPFKSKNSSKLMLLLGKFENYFEITNIQLQKRYVYMHFLDWGHMRWIKENICFFWVCK